MSESQRVPELPEGAYIRRVTMADKEEVLRIHNNVQDGLDDLPAYYDYLTSLPDMYPVAVVCDEKMVGFLMAHIVDGGETMVMRSGRVNPQYQGKNILKAMSYHVACWAVEERGVKSIVSMEREKSPLQETKPGRYKNIKHTWKFALVTLDPQIFEVIHERDRIITAGLEDVSDGRLSELFQDSGMRNYIAPRGVLSLRRLPLKPRDSNIPVLRGLDGSTQIYSDVELNKSGWHGLLSFSVKYATQKGARTSYYIYLDILGDDLSSLRKHLIRHLIDLTNSLKDEFALRITLPNGLGFDEIGEVFKEYNVEIEEEWRLDTSTCFRSHLMHWWREGVP